MSARVDAIEAMNTAYRMWADSSDDDPPGRWMLDALSRYPELLARLAIETGAIEYVGAVRCSTAQFAPTINRYAGPVYRTRHSEWLAASRERAR